MRCSSSDPALDAYLDGTLAPLQRARVATHLATCAACADLFEELRVVDALLLQPRRLEPAANFSFKVMAEIRAMPAPHVPRGRPLAVLSTYVVFAWVAIGSFLAFGGASARASLALLSELATRFGREAHALADASGRLFGHRTIDVTAAMGALLAVDLASAFAFVAAFAILRSRRASRTNESW